MSRLHLFARLERVGSAHYCSGVSKGLFLWLRCTRSSMPCFVPLLFSSIKFWGYFAVNMYHFFLVVLFLNSYFLPYVCIVDANWCWCVLPSLFVLFALVCVLTVHLFTMEMGRDALSLSFCRCLVHFFVVCLQAGWLFLHVPSPVCLCLFFVFLHLSFYHQMKKHSEQFLRKHEMFMTWAPRLCSDQHRGILQSPICFFFLFWVTLFLLGARRGRRAQGTRRKTHMRKGRGAKQAHAIPKLTHIS